MKINNITLIKIKFVLNEESVWVAKTQKAYAEEEHDKKEEEELHVCGDDEFVNMFEMPLTTSFF